jgi:tetratricopeptide (TPR) repeat protein
MNNLGGLYTKQRNYEQAAALLGEALDARLRVLGGDHLHVGYSHYNLGCLSASLGKRGEALDHLRNAVSLGWAERDILTDTTLDSLRGDPEFEAVVAEVKKRVGGE